MFSINIKNRINSRRKMLFAFFVVLVFAVGSIFPGFAFGALNKQINYQGKLTDEDNMAVTDASYNMEFKLYTVDTGGNAIWTETRTGSNRVPVVNGLFSVMLGQVSSLASVNFNQTLYLSVNIGGIDTTPTWDGEMSPRKILGVVPGAIESEHSAKASNLVGGNSTTLLGSIPYQSNTDTTSLLSPNTTTAKKFLRMTGTGTNGATPAWDTLVNGDIPTTLSGKTYNGLSLTANATGFSIAGGTTSKTLTVKNTLSFSGTDDSTLNIGNGGTLGSGAFADISLFVPYTGATTTVNLGAQALTTTGIITAGQIIDSGLTSGYLPYASVSKQLVDSLLYTDNSAVGIGTTSLSGMRFKVSLDNIAVSDSYNNEDKISFNVGGVISGGSLKLYDDGVCGSYTVTGQDGLTYGTVLGADGKCWLDRNLGATQVATSSTDLASYGDLYQWGRLKDGHQVVTSGTTATLSTGDNPEHDDFILDSNTSPYDWRSPQNNNLWQGVSGTNNVCPVGFRLPTQAEWSTLVSAENITNSASAFSSSLKLPVAGNRGHSSGGVYGRGSYGNYWSSSVTGVYAYHLDFNASAVNPSNGNYRAYGFSVRCVKD